MSEEGKPRLGRLQPGDPDRIDVYEILGRLGAGGMGVVYLGQSPTGRKVAVKVVHASLAHDEEFRARFRGEVASARKVPPFCTAEVLDANPDAALPYLVVEYVDGPTLSAEVGRNGPLSTANLHAVAVGIATALTVIHEAGVIHRDLKPGNVLLAPGSPKVIDFGIARALQPTGTQHTRTGEFVGTVNYMAPERFEEPGTSITAAADVFAWGCVVAYAGTGHPPFEAESPMSTLGKILTQPPVLDGLDDGPLRRLVEQALLSDPARRPTARELLDQLLSGGPAPIEADPVLDDKPLADPTAPRRLPVTGGRVARGIARRTRRARHALPAAESPFWRNRFVLAAGVVLVLVLTGGAGVAVARSVGSGSAPPAVDVLPVEQPPIKAANVTTSTYGPFFLYGLSTEMCVAVLDVRNQAGRQDPCDKENGFHQLFQFLPQGRDPSGNEVYLVQNVDDKMCLGIPREGRMESGMLVGENLCTSADRQDFRLETQFVDGGRTYYWLIHVDSALCLGVDPDGGPDSSAMLVSCGNGDEQKWAFLDQSGW